MKSTTNSLAHVAIPPGLLDAIREFPSSREVDHCGRRFLVNPLAIYAQCPHCGAELKVRAMSAVEEVEDVIDAVLQWMNQPQAGQAAEQRAADLRQEDEA